MRRTGWIISFLAVTLFISACSSTAPDLDAQAIPREEKVSLERVSADLPDFRRVVGGQTFTLVATLDRPAPAGGVELLLDKSNVNTYVTSFPQFGSDVVVVPEGETQLEIPVETLPIGGAELPPSGARSQTVFVRLERSDTTNSLDQPFLFFITADPERPVQVLEAEDADLSGAINIDERTSFTGGAAAEFPLGENAQVSFDVTVDEAGTYLLVLGYAELLGPSFGRTHFANLAVNGSTSRLTLISTPGNSGSGVRNEPLEVELEAGENVISLSTDASAAPGGFVLDRINVSR